MLRRVWQATMIRLAGNGRVKNFMQSRTTMSQLATRYVGGISAADAVEIAQGLARQHVRSSLFYLGEYVNTPELVERNVENKLAAIDVLKAADLDIHVSIDPTQIGFSIDRETARRNAQIVADRLKSAAAGRPGVHCLMIDMEDPTVTTATIALHDELLDQGYPVGQTLQAFLKRTETDVRRKIDQGGKVRLVRGAFVAGSAIAYTRLADVKANYLALARLMLSRDAKARGFYPIFATHDDVLHEQIMVVARQCGWRQGEYEFEMLYGARPDVTEHLVRRGERVRLYLPFGTDWWPYAIRRIGENPRNAYLLAKAILARR